MKNFTVNLGDFEKLNLIGTGGFGSVYKVKEKSTGKLYAAKISNEMITSKEDMVEISREVNNLCKIGHPSILKLRGFIMNHVQ